MHSMTSETVAEHTRPILAEVSQLTMQVRDLAEMVRGLTMEVRDLAGKVRDVTVEVRDLTVEVRDLGKVVATHDRKLDVLSAQMRLVIGAFGLLITALIAVFGILFTR